MTSNAQSILNFGYIQFFSWDNYYNIELKNFQENSDDGEIWFGRSAENRIIKFVVENINLNSKIADIGCGNGSLLRRLVIFIED